jgi:gamma-glutamylcyclotransferase (GGCT)/AIG2-like uncharacterized protein YtfP
MVLSHDPGDVVFGELFSLHTPEASFVLLDDYEGCGLAEPRYLRQVVPVTREEGGVAEAWTYIYNRPVTQLKRIDSGRFVKR